MGVAPKKPSYTGNFVGQVASGEGVYHVKPVE